LRSFGINIGIGFQLKDDLLDAYADPKKFGKQVGGDIIANKKTFLLIKAIEKAKGKEKKELNEWLSVKRFNKKEKVEAVKALYDTLGVQSMTEKKVNQFFAKGFNSLQDLTAKPKVVEPLKHYAQALIERQS
jgi:geranylgeranyl diphosphate synthase, type II